MSAGQNLVFRDTPPLGVLKLVDFGCARRMSGSTPLATPVGSVNFSAPEVWTATVSGPQHVVQCSNASA
jgi:serine/threonine protein kinase